jgi:hypothetical protein
MHRGHSVITFKQAQEDPEIQHTARAAALAVRIELCGCGTQWCVVHISPLLRRLASVFFDRACESYGLTKLALMVAPSEAHR